MPMQGLSSASLSVSYAASLDSHFRGDDGGIFLSRTAPIAASLAAPLAWSKPMPLSWRLQGILVTACPAHIWHPVTLRGAKYTGHPAPPRQILRSALATDIPVAVALTPRHTQASGEPATAPS